MLVALPNFDTPSDCPSRAVGRTFSRGSSPPGASTRRGPPAIPLGLLWLLAALACGEPAAPPPEVPRNRIELSEPEFLLLITVDTLRADRLGSYGSHRDFTPHLDALAGESQMFLAAYTPAPFTLPSLASLLTGAYPEEVGIWSNESRLLSSLMGMARAARGGNSDRDQMPNRWKLYARAKAPNNETPNISA